MKKVFFYELVLTLVLSVAGFRANAQVSYIGGSFSLGASNSHRVDHGTLQNVFDFSVAPDLGWDLSDNVAVGVRPTFGYLRATNVNQENRTVSVGINPYGRYRLLDIRRFGVWAEADADLSYSDSQNLDGKYVISTTRTTAWGIQVLPVLTYRLSGHVSLETRLNIFSFGLTGAHVVNVNVSDSNITSFGLNATSEDILGDLGDITVGFLYRF